MTSLQCGCCMQVSVCVCWWFKKNLGRSISSDDVSCVVLLCSAGYKEACYFFVCSKVPNNQIQRNFNVSSGLTVWILKSCKG